MREKNCSHIPSLHTGHRTVLSMSLIKHISLVGRYDFLPRMSQLGYAPMYP